MPSPLETYPAVAEGGVPDATGALGPQQLLEAEMLKYLQEEFGGEDSDGWLRPRHGDASARLVMVLVQYIEVADQAEVGRTNLRPKRRQQPRRSRSTFQGAAK